MRVPLLPNSPSSQHSPQVPAPPLNRKVAHYSHTAKSHRHSIERLPPSFMRYVLSCFWTPLCLTWAPPTPSTVYLSHRHEGVQHTPQPPNACLPCTRQPEPPSEGTGLLTAVRDGDAAGPPILWSRTGPTTCAPSPGLWVPPGPVRPPPLSSGFSACKAPLEREHP